MSRNNSDISIYKDPNKQKKIQLKYNTLRSGVLILRSVNHPLRKKIIDLLFKHEKMTVTEIYVKLRLEQSVASQHLAILRRAEILETKREGKFIYYSVNQERLTNVHELITSISSL